MLFSLEVMQADHGDCLMLHFGSPTSPDHIVIDGGPKGIYKKFLKPRLLEIRNNRAISDKLPISMVMVSHMDDDHANGICVMTDELINDAGAAPFDVGHMWINTFDDIIGNIQLPAIASVAASANAVSFSEGQIPGIRELEKHDHHIVAVIASTGQGRQLRDNAKTLSITLNHPFTATGGSVKLVRGDAGKTKVTWDQGLKITVLCPDDERLRKLQKKWDDDLKKAKANGDDSIIMATITSLDTSPFNLSSIVCLVEFKGKTILLTGDARSDDILEGLKSNKLLDESEKLHVDILKMPHHGSDRNMQQEFLEKVTADHYVISANGAYENPDLSLLTMMADTLSKGTIHITNKTGKLHIEEDVEKFQKKLKKDASKVKVKFIADGKDSMVIDLLDAIDF
jgi:hypothetical protein